MSGAIAVTSAVVAIGAAVASEGATFAVIAAVGATIGAVGAVTHVKELQYAGAAIGAVGLVGGLASAAGMFGEVAGSAAGAGGSFGPTGAGELGLANSGGAAASAATDTASWAGSAAGEAGAAAAPTTGYAASSFGPTGSGELGLANGGGQTDFISMVNGQTTPPTGTVDVATASAPAVNPEVAASTTQAAPVDAEATAGPTAGPPAQTVDAPPAPLVNGKVEVPGAPRGMLDMANTPRDEFGNVVPQGDNPDGGSLGSFGNPAANGGGGNGAAAPAAQPTTGVQPVTGTNASSGIAGADPATPVASQVTGTASANPMDAGIPGSYDKYAAAVGLNGPAKMGAAGGSTWDSIWQFTQKNPMMAFGAMQAAGSFLTGSLSPLPQAQVAELNARAQQNQAAANLYNQQQALLQQRLSNMSQPIPVASRAPQGLINSVTGRV